MSNAALEWDSRDSNDWTFADGNLAGFSIARQMPVRILRPDMSPRTSKLDPAWKWLVDGRIEQIGQLHRNWDRRGSAGVRSDVLEFVGSILHQVLRPNDPPPGIVPLGHGGVQLSWAANGAELDIEVAAPLQVSVYYVDAHGHEREWDTQSDFAPISAALSEMM